MRVIPKLKYHYPIPKPLSRGVGSESVEGFLKYATENPQKLIHAQKLLSRRLEVRNYVQKSLLEITTEHRVFVLGSDLAFLHSIQPNVKRTPLQGYSKGSWMHTIGSSEKIDHSEKVKSKLILGEKFLYFSSFEEHRIVKSTKVWENRFPFTTEYNSKARICSGTILPKDWKGLIIVILLTKSVREKLLKFCSSNPYAYNNIIICQDLS